MKSSALRPKAPVFIMYLLPGLALYTYIALSPIISSLRLSFYMWTGGKKITYVGWANYQNLFKDEIFWRAFGNNLVITLLCIVGQIGFAFLFSSMLNSRWTWLKSFHRTVAYFPVTLSAVIVGFTWSFIFNYNYGLLNAVLRMAGLKEWAQPWLDNPKSIIYIISIPIIWQYIGFYMIILLAAITSIDKEVFEMAELDGANGLQKAFKITLPMIRNTLIVTVMLCISGNMRIFDHIYVMTGGGPGTSSMVMAMHAYNASFIKYQLSYGSTLSIAILVLSLLLIVLSRTLLNPPWTKGGNRRD
jgi:raffinose/stachyose/melibiose transport system permease protein